MREIFLNGKINKVIFLIKRFKRENPPKTIMKKTKKSNTKTKQNDKKKNQGFDVHAIPSSC
jgi:hypothetical protein